MKTTVGGESEGTCPLRRCPGASRAQQRVDLGTDKSVHCSIPLHRAAQVFRQERLWQWKNAAHSPPGHGLWQPCRKRDEREGFTSFLAYGAFVNGRADEITTFGGGRGAARLLTLLSLPCPALIKIRAMPAQNADEVLRWTGGRAAAPSLPHAQRPESCQQMRGVFGRAAQLGLPLIGGFI